MIGLPVLSMAVSPLQIWSLIIIGLYTAFTLFIGLGVGYRKESVSTARGYFIGTGTGNFILFFTTVATWFSTGIYMGVIGSLYKNGIGWVGISSWQLVVVTTMGFFGPRFWKLSKVRNYVTPADLVASYFDSKLFRYIMAIGMIAFCVPSMMAQIKGVAWALSGITGGIIDYRIGIFYAAVIVGIYVFFGGFRSQAWVDTAQGLLFVVILWGCLIIISATNGGWKASWDRLIETAPGILFYKGPGEYWTWQRYLSFFILQGLGGYLAPYVWQRSYAAKSGRDMKKIAGRMGMFFCFGVALPVVFSGMHMHVMMPQMTNPENGLVTFMSQFHPFWGIMVTIGILAAGMSTISSIVVSVSSIVTEDIIRPLRPKNVPDSELLKYGKAGILLVMAVGVGLSFVNLHTIEILINLTLAGFTQIIIPLLGIFVFKRMTTAGAISGYVAGLIMTFVGTIQLNNPGGFMGGMWGLLVNAIVCIVVSAMTKPISPMERARWLAPVSKPDKTVAKPAIDRAPTN